MFQPPPLNAFTTNAADTPVPYALNAKVMVGVIILLFLVIYFILILLVYAKWFMQRSSQSYVISRSVAFASSQGAAAPSAQNNIGLDKATIAQLHTFVYTATSPLDSLEAVKSDESYTRSSLECAVCLSEFQENEKGRILPACKHAFHTECIDMWLFSHSTCPLCRANVAPSVATSAKIASTPQPHRPQGAMERSAGTTEGNSVTLNTIEYPRNVILWGNQMQVSSSSQETSTSSLPVSSLLLAHGARALPHITIEIPPAEGNMVASSSGHLSAKCTTEQEAGYSQQLKSPGFRVSIKRMLSRQSSGHKSSSQENNIEETHN